jgi:hypothetical protein
MSAPAGKLVSGRPFSEAYVLLTAELRPVRRHSADLPLCTKPVSGGNAEETEMKLSSVLLATAVLGAALVATSEPAAAYHRYGGHCYRRGRHVLRAQISRRASGLGVSGILAGPR